MIYLHFKNRQPELIKGNVIHLRIVANERISPNRHRLVVDDITPLPGAEPTGYGCGICGRIEAANPDGSLPDGWIVREFEQGLFYVCNDPGCQAEPVCRVCGCTNENACQTPDGPCHWVEKDLCSACAGNNQV